MIFQPGRKVLPVTLLLAVLSIGACTADSSPLRAEETGSATHPEPSADPGDGAQGDGAALPAFAPRSDETIREQQSSEGIAEFTWNTSGITAVFVTYAVCEPGVHLEMLLVDSTEETYPVPVICDRVINREATLHDPSTLQFDNLEVRVTGEGQWRVALAESSGDPHNYVSSP